MQNSTFIIQNCFALEPNEPNKRNDLNDLNIVSDKNATTLDIL